MIRDTDFDKYSHEMECDVEIYEKKIAEYINWVKLDQSKRVWPEGCMRLGTCTFRNRTAQNKFVAVTGGLLRIVKQDGEGKCSTTLLFFLIFYMCVYKRVLPSFRCYVKFQFPTINCEPDSPPWCAICITTVNVFNNKVRLMNHI